MPKKNKKRFDIWFEFCANRCECRTGPRFDRRNSVCHLYVRPKRWNVLKCSSQRCCRLPNDGIHSMAESMNPLCVCVFVYQVNTAKTKCNELYGIVRRRRSSSPPSQSHFCTKIWTTTKLLHLPDDPKGGVLFVFNVLDVHTYRHQLTASDPMFALVLFWVSVCVSSMSKMRSTQILFHLIIYCSLTCG